MHKVAGFLDIVNIIMIHGESNPFDFSIDGKGFQSNLTAAQTREKESTQCSGAGYPEFFQKVNDV
jgi:hypothetical protein